MTDHKKPMWLEREEEHARQMRIVAWNVLVAAIVVFIYLRWL